MKEYRYFKEILPNKNNILFKVYNVISDETYENTYLKLKDVIPKLKKLKDIYLPNNIIEICPKSNFKTAWNTNVLSILYSCNIRNIKSIEESIIYDMDKYDISKMDDMLKDVYPFNNIKKDIIIKKDIYPILENKYIKKEEVLINYDKDNIILFEKDKYTNTEIIDILESNSEHCRHHFFNSILTYIIANIYSYSIPESLFELIKKPYEYLKPKNSIIAFKDNASAIKGYNLNHYIYKSNNKIKTQNKLTHFTFKAETHNFPTMISPFPASETGVGGRIRDTICIGRGGCNIAGLAGYCVGNLHIPNYKVEWEDEEYKDGFLLPSWKILIGASNGASDYGNKIGEPIIGGFTRSFGRTFKNLYIDKKNDYCEYKEERMEWIKPIMFSGGIGTILDINKDKYKPKHNYKIIKIGGDAYKIGMSGSSMSSVIISDNNNKEKYKSSVQRGDPCMENKICRVIKKVANDDENPIMSIHDQGAGGMGNVIKELIEPLGADINLCDIKLGDNTMTSSEIWSSEYQENVYLLTKGYEDFIKIEEICKREGVNCNLVGSVKDDKILIVKDFRNKDNEKVIDLDLSKKYKFKKNRKQYYIKNNEHNDKPNIINTNNDIIYSSNFSNNNQIYIHNVLYKVLSLLSVGSKRFLTNKVDRSVSGLIAQQQCIGYLQTPLSNFSLISGDYMGKYGIASSIGERSMLSLINNSEAMGKMVRMTIGECLTNLMFVLVSDYKDIKIAGNWMWPAKIDEYENYYLYKAVESVSSFLIELGICIDGGKDSVSMYSQIKDKIVKSPRTFVASSYCTCPDITKKITPDLKSTKSCIMFIDLGFNSTNLGCSSYCQVYNEYDDYNSYLLPDFKPENIIKFINCFKLIQELIKENKILAGHDRSDGGLITTLCEMSLSSGIGISVYLNTKKNIIEYLFNEELGLVIEIEEDIKDEILNKFKKIEIPIYDIGRTNINNIITIVNKRDNEMMECVLYSSIYNVIENWEKTSYELEKIQIGEKLANLEMKYLLNLKIENFNWNISEKIWKKLENINLKDNRSDIRVAIIRCEGSNGDKEMINAFYIAGFDVYDICMNDLLSSDRIPETYLNNFRGIVFVGGFSNSDCLGSAIGWYSCIKNNTKLCKEFKDFFKREDTFSFGVCNGFQLMTLLGLFDNKEKDIKYEFKENESNRFESRFLNVMIPENNSIMMKDMDKLKMGIWIAHGEGNFSVSNKDIKDNELNISMKYDGDIYPLNPNGSIYNIAGLVSVCGRHLGLMPHPERVIMDWQLPYKSKNYIRNKNNLTPWFFLFKNAYNWCINS
jgi:phosphoribosylformylglycinamidine synthase